MHTFAVLLCSMFLLLGAVSVAISGVAFSEVLGTDSLPTGVTLVAAGMSFLTALITISTFRLQAAQYIIYCPICWEFAYQLVSVADLMVFQYTPDVTTMKLVALGTFLAKDVAAFFVIRYVSGKVGLGDAGVRGYRNYGTL